MCCYFICSGISCFKFKYHYDVASNNLFNDISFFTTYKYKKGSL